MEDIYDKDLDDIAETVLLFGLKGKIPKVLAGYLAILNELLVTYGIHRMKYMKAYMPSIVSVINGNKLAAVKTEGANLLK